MSKTLDRRRRKEKEKVRGERSGEREKTEGFSIPDQGKEDSVNGMQVSCGGGKRREGPVFWGKGGGHFHRRSRGKLKPISLPDLVAGCLWAVKGSPRWSTGEKGKEGSPTTSGRPKKDFHRLGTEKGLLAWEVSFYGNDKKEVETVLSLQRAKRKKKQKGGKHLRGREI